VPLSMLHEEYQHESFTLYLDNVISDQLLSVCFSPGNQRLW